jgi:hypothetical protein
MAPRSRREATIWADADPMLLPEKRSLAPALI